MSSQNLCVDIFSQMADLLANFNANLARSNPSMSSHDQGFVSGTTPQPSVTTNNYE